MQDQNPTARAFAQHPFGNLLRRSNDSNHIEPLSDCVLFLKQVVAVCVYVVGIEGRGKMEEGCYFSFICIRDIFCYKISDFQTMTAKQLLRCIYDCESKREKHLSAQKLRWISPSDLFNSYTERQRAFILEGKKNSPFSYIISILSVKINKKL